MARIPTTTITINLDPDAAHLISRLADNFEGLIEELRNGRTSTLENTDGEDPPAADLRIDWQPTNDDAELAQQPTPDWLTDPAAQVKWGRDRLARAVGFAPVGSPVPLTPHHPESGNVEAEPPGSEGAYHAILGSRFAAATVEEQLEKVLAYTDQLETTVHIQAEQLHTAGDWKRREELAGQSIRAAEARIAELQDAAAEATNALGRALTEAAQAGDRIATLEAERHHLLGENDRVNTLGAQVEQLVEERDEARAVAQAEAQGRHDVQAERNRLGALYDQAIATIQAQSEAIMLLEQQRDTALEGTVQAEAAQAELQNLASEAQTRVEELLSEGRQLERQVANWRELNSQLEQKAKARIDKLTRDRDEIEAERDNLERVVDQHRDVITKQGVLVRELEERVGVVNGDNARLERERDDLEAERDDLETTTNDHAQVTNQQRTLISNTREALAQATQEAEVYRARVAELEAEPGNWKQSTAAGRIAELEQELLAAGHRYQVIQEEYAANMEASRDRIAELEAERGQLAADLTDWRELRVKLTACTQQNERQAGTIGEMRATIESQRAMLRNLANETDRG